MSRASPELIPGTGGRVTWGRKDEEYMADFCLVSKRTLDEEEYRIFRFHFLLGADWRLCTRRLQIDRGSFFHAVYRIEQKLGRAFRELEPYCLYPLQEYFHGPRRMVGEGLCRPVRPRAAPRLERLSIRVPLLKTA